MPNESDARWRSILESLPDYLFTCTSDGQLTYLDPRLLALLGLKEAEGAANGWSERVHPDDRERTIVEWRTALAEGRDFRVEYRLRQADGEYRWFAVRARLCSGADGKPSHFVGTVGDITDFVETRVALRSEQIRLAKMAAASPLMLYSFRQTADGMSTFPYVSPAFCKLFGVVAEELTRDASSFFRLGNPDDAPALVASVAQSKENLTLWQYQWRVTVPELGEIWIEAHSAPVREADGTTVWHGSLANVTERRRADAEIRRLNGELEERVAQRTAELEGANRELEAFSYSVSHDLREPLRAINGFSRAVVDDFGDLLPAAGQRQLAAVRDGASRMARLIDDLLSFSRLSRQPLRRRQTDLRRVVEECLEELAAAGAKASVQVGEILPSEVDSALIKQVFFNLLSNAFKYSRQNPQPEVAVDSHADGGKIVYSVRDNGVGFDMKYAPKLFHVFQRLHAVDEFEGTGVGLAIVHRIVSRHGGRVWVDAAPGAGATFFFAV
jgi:PAS domain S-box-containing protein